MFNQIGEINVICTNLEQSLIFYRDVLGFNVMGEEEGAVHLSCGNHAFLLLPIAKTRRELKPYETVTEFSFDLLVNDLKSASDYLKSKNVSFDKMYKEGESYAVIRDPDGLAIEIVQS